MTRGEQLPPQYNPTGLETSLYETWEKSGFFSPDLPTSRPPVRPYVIMMPPPNVTANLHMGHGLTYTLQDVLIRFERMRGRATLWLPGTDHAGIATQNVVEKDLRDEGKTRFDLGRDGFVRRVWAHVETTGSTILRQLRSLGASCDWERTYFTLDDDLSRAVREVFVTLFEKGLIYRGKYIINWCPAVSPPCQMKKWNGRRPRARSGGSAIPWRRIPPGISWSRPPGRKRCWATPP